MLTIEEPFSLFQSGHIFCKKCYLERYGPSVRQEEDYQREKKPGAGLVSDPQRACQRCCQPVTRPSLWAFSISDQISYLIWQESTTIQNKLPIEALTTYITFSYLARILLNNWLEKYLNSFSCMYKQTFKIISHPLMFPKGTWLVEFKV